MTDYNRSAVQRYVQEPFRKKASSCTRPSRRMRHKHTRRENVVSISDVNIWNKFGTNLEQIRDNGGDSPSGVEQFSRGIRDNLHESLQPSPSKVGKDAEKRCEAIVRGDCPLHRV